MFAEYPTAQHREGLRRLWQEAFADDDLFLDKFFSTGYSPDHCRILAHGNEVAAALYWFDCQWGSRKLAYLYAVATTKAYRGQGLCRRLLEDVHGLLSRQGYAGAVLVPGEKALFSLYEKMGYRVMSSISEFSCSAGEPGLPLTALSPAEYARCRRQLLPRDGIVQEGAGLDFLASFCVFYQGEACLLCARKEGDRLFVSELLGDPETAGGILQTLGCREGSFRMPGKDRPFAMYRSLSDSAAPAYLGHAFD